MKEKYVLMIVGFLVTLIGALPLIKPYLPQLSAIPTEGIIYQIILIVIGIISIGYAFQKKSLL